MDVIDPTVIEPYRGLINYWGLQTVAMMLTMLKRLREIIGRDRTVASMELFPSVDPPPAKEEAKAKAEEQKPPG